MAKNKKKTLYFLRDFIPQPLKLNWDLNYYCSNRLAIWNCKNLFPFEGKHMVSCYSRQLFPTFCLVQSELSIRLRHDYCINRALPVLFCAVFLRIWKQNLPLKWAIFDVVFYPMFPNCAHATSAGMFTLLNVKLFFDQIVENLLQNAPEVVRFLKTFHIWVFLKK